MIGKRKMPKTKRSCALMHDSGFGHDKSLTIRPYAQLPPDQRPTMFYAGDGVSDLSAARETDLLFAKKGRGKSESNGIEAYVTDQSADLVRYCVKENVPFTEFEDWSSILREVKAIVEGRKSVQDAARDGYEQYKSGNAGLNGKPK